MSTGQPPASRTSHLAPRAPHLAPRAPHLAPRAPHLAPRTSQWIVLVALFVLSLPAVTPRIYSSDEIQYFAFLRSLWFDHDLSFENEYTYFYERGVGRSDGFRETFLELRTDTGRRINFATIGCAILWSPFYAAGDLAARATGAPRDGYSKPYLAAVAYGSAVYGFLALVLAVACAERLGYNAFAGALAVWFGTALTFYMYVAPPFSHACSAFAVALFTWVWLRVRGQWTPRGMAALAAAGALMVMVREQDVFFGVAVAVDFGLWALGDSQSPKPTAQRLLQRLLVAAGAFAIAYAPQLAAYKIINGHFGPHASVSNKMHWWGPHALQVMFSPEHGYFIWTPLALLAIAGLVLPPKGGSYGDVASSGVVSSGVVSSGVVSSGVVSSGVASSGVASSGVASTFRWKRQAMAILLLMVALQFYIGGSVESWTVAGGFGQRRLVAITTALVIGYSSLWGLTRGTKARAALVIASALTVYWNLALTAEFATGLMDRQKLEPRQNAYDAVVTLPRMAPSLVYRYLFDRSSFYQRANPVSR